MLFVMLAHARSPLSPIFYLFHMPLFFFLSGYLFRMEKYSSLRDFFRAKWHTLLIPYFCFATLNAIIWIVVNAQISTSAWAPTLMRLCGSVIAIRDVAWTSHMGPSWFISCLLVTEIMYYFLLKITTGRPVIYRLVLVGSIGAMGFIYASLHGIFLPWAFDVAPVALLFFAGGHAIKAYSKQLSLVLNTKYIIVAAILGIVGGLVNGLFGNTYHGHADMSLSIYGNQLLFVIGAFSGIYLVILAAKKLPQLKAVQFVGRYSIVYLCLHKYPIYTMMQDALSRAKLDSLNLNINYTSLHGVSGLSLARMLGGSFVLSTAYVLAACSMITVVVLFLDRFAPWMLGKHTSVSSNIAPA